MTFHHSLPFAPGRGEHNVMTTIAARTPRRRPPTRCRCRQLDVEHMQRSRHLHRYCLPEMPPLEERLVASGRIAEHCLQQRNHARNADHEANAEREISGLRTVVGPAHAQSVAVIYHHTAKQQPRSISHHVDTPLRRYTFLTFSNNDLH